MGGSKRTQDAMRSSQSAHRWALGALRSRWMQAAIGVCLIATFVLGFTLASRPAHAATLDVCSSCAYKSINDAIGAASPGDTIQVQAGTYGPNEPGATTNDAQIVINKPITLLGAGSGTSGSIIDDHTAHPGTATYGVITISALSSTGAVTISGFRIEGANNQDANNDGVLLSINDTHAGDTITVQNNLFYGDTTLDSQLLMDQTDAIVLAQTPGATSILNNQFQGVFRGALVYENPGPVTFRGNDFNLHPIYEAPTLPAIMDNWAEGVYFIVDNATSVSTPQIVSGNTFENYLGLGVGVNGGYKNGLTGAISNVAISGNVFKDQGVMATYSAPTVSSAVLLHGWNASSTVSNVSVSNNVFSQASGTGQGYGIGLTGHLLGGVTIDHNVLQGSGSSRPPAGVNFTAVTSSMGVSITNNIVSGFADGISADALPSGVLVSATQNCIAGNTSAGATAASGASITADHNWWGAANGPNPPGSGDAVSGPVTITPFLTAPAAICAGPVASNVKASPSPALAHTAITLTGSLSDSATGGFAIASAQYNVDGGAYSPMNAQDGSFDQITEAVTANLSGIAAGAHTLCARGTDAFGNLGAASCVALTVNNPAPAPTATPTPRPAPKSTPTPKPTATATATATVAPTPADTATPTGTGGSPGVNATGPSSGSGFPWIPFIIALVIFLALVAALAIFLLRRRADEQRQ